jgi:hypothetical protein
MLLAEAQRFGGIWGVRISIGVGVGIGIGIDLSGVRILNGRFDTDSEERQSGTQPSGPA